MCPATTGTVAEVFAEEQARLLPHAAHPFPTERLVPVRSAKTIYVRFDLNQYSIPPEAVGRQLTLAASDTLIRILEGTREIARHRRSYDRRQLVLDPAHQDAVLKSKRKTAHSTPTGRLEKLVPESKAFLDQAFAHGESTAHEAARLSKLLEQYGAHAVRPAIAEALDRSTPRSCSVAFLLRRQPRSTPLALDLSRHPQAQSLDVRPHDLETYDELARWPKAEAQERSKCSLEWRLRFSGLKSFKPMADFDWSWPKKIGRDIIDRAFTLDFLNEARNLVLVGRNGLDKTMIAQNLCHTAVLAGHSVLFRSAAALLEELHRQSPEGRRRKLRTYANVGLLCIDEVGYLSFDDKAADLLYEVVNCRYERKPLIITTNRPFKEWNEVFPNATCIVTLLDRLLHHADVILVEGNSYRVRESEQESAARRKNQ